MTNSNNDFFKKEEDKKDMTDAPQTEQVDKIKLGETEYSQDELDKLVGLGKQAEEFQSKWNTPLEGLYKGYTKTTQELSEIKTKLQTLEDEKQKKEYEARSTANQLTPDEMRQQALREADELGLVHRGNVRDEVLKVIQARDLNNEIDHVVSEMSSRGLPKMTGDELLDYMEETGIRNPEKAYKDKFEDQYSQWKEEQLRTVKKDGLVTDTSSVQGGKEPETVKITKDNLTELLASRLYSE